MKNLMGSIVCVGGLLVSTSALAQMKEPARVDLSTQQVAGAVGREKEDPEMAQLRQQMGEVDRGLLEVRQRLGVAGRDRSALKDEDVAQLYDAAEKARRAFEDKSREVIKTDSEGSQILAQMEDLKKKQSDLVQQQRDLERKLIGVAQRMGLQPSRGEHGAAPAATVDPAFMALRTSAESARKALEDKIAERLKADPEGGKLLKQRDDLIAKYQATHQPSPTRKPEVRQP